MRLYHRSSGGIPVRAPRDGPVPRPRRHGAREQRRLLDVPRAGAARLVRRRRGDAPDRRDPRADGDRLPLAARRGRDGLDRRAPVPPRHEELRARVRSCARTTASSPKRRASSSATTTRAERAGPSRTAGERDWRREHVRAHRPRQRPAGPDGEPAVRAVGDVHGHDRRRLALRDRRLERHRALRRAHVLQGDGAPPDRARHRGRDRRDRRRVQRVHRQGVDGVLRQVRGRAPRRRARRHRRHAPQLALRRRGDRAREGRDRRGDEHVLRHAARLHQRRLRVAPLRRPAARLGHPRPQGDGARRDARHVPLLSRRLVPPGAHGRRHRRPHRRRRRRAPAVAARRPAGGEDRHARAGRGRTRTGA